MASGGTLKLVFNSSLQQLGDLPWNTFRGHKDAPCNYQVPEGLPSPSDLAMPQLRIQLWGVLEPLLTCVKKNTACGRIRQFVDDLLRSAFFCVFESGRVMIKLDGGSVDAFFLP